MNEKHSNSYNPKLKEKKECDEKDENRLVLLSSLSNALSFVSSMPRRKDQDIPINLLFENTKSDGGSVDNEAKARSLNTSLHAWGCDMSDTACSNEKASSFELSSNQIEFTKAQSYPDGAAKSDVKVGSKNSAEPQNSPALNSHSSKEEKSHNEKDKNVEINSDSNEGALNTSNMATLSSENTYSYSISGHLAQTMLSSPPQNSLSTDGSNKSSNKAYGMRPSSLSTSTPALEGNFASFISKCSPKKLPKTPKAPKAPKTPKMSTLPKQTKINPSVMYPHSTHNHIHNYVHNHAHVQSLKAPAPLINQSESGNMKVNNLALSSAIMSNGHVRLQRRRSNSVDSFTTMTHLIPRTNNNGKMMNITAANPTIHNASTSHSISVTPLRRGKWTAEEEEYVAQVIKDFNSGYLNAPAGTTLRTYLSEKLHCDPMRITKKFTGDSCIGKRVFHPAVRTASNSEEIDKSQAKLAALEKRWRRRLEMQQGEMSKKSLASITAGHNHHRISQHSQQMLSPLHPFTHFIVPSTSSSSSATSTIRSQQHHSHDLVGGILNDAAHQGQAAEITQTATWLDRANTILSKRTTLETNVDSEIKEVEKLLHEGPTIKHALASIPSGLFQHVQATKLDHNINKSNNNNSSNNIHVHNGNDNHQIKFTFNSTTKSNQRHILHYDHNNKYQSKKKRRRSYSANQISSMRNTISPMQQLADMAAEEFPPPPTSYASPHSMSTPLYTQTTAPALDSEHVHFTNSTNSILRPPLKDTVVATTTTTTATSLSPSTNTTLTTTGKEDAEALVSFLNCVRKESYRASL